MKKISFKSNNKNIFKFILNIVLKTQKPDKSYKKYKYNNFVIFYYFIKIIDDSINVKIILDKNYKNLQLHIIGAFIFDLSSKYQASLININYNGTNKEILENLYFGFKRKDYIFNEYLNNSQKEQFESNFKLNSKNSSLLNSINFMKLLVSLPSNILYPKTYCDFIKKNIDSKKVNITYYNKAKIKKIGMNCLLSVAQGSQREPRVVTFKSKSLRSKVCDILFVGKGVCFDSGGISIKPSGGMEDMKWDMAGSAVVCGLMKYLSEINPQISFAGIVGLVENMPSHNAYKPGDVIKSYKGINVEVLNTDAEGRLVLADIITYGCEKYNPKIVIDFATLTGAIMVALGQHYAGLFSNDDKLSKTLYEAGIDTNEKVWRMPLHDDFDRELSSPFVDVKNIGAGRYGGSVTAAQFLQRFVPNNTKWAHLDIAGTTWKNAGDIMNNKASTGFGLTLIADFISKYFKI